MLKSTIRPYINAATNPQQTGPKMPITTPYGSLLKAMTSLIYPSFSRFKVRAPTNILSSFEECVNADIRRKTTFFTTCLDLLDIAKALCYTLYINLIEVRVL